MDIVEPMNQSRQKRPNFFARCWNGQARLWQAFWLCGVCGKLLVISLLFFLAIPFYDYPGDEEFVIVLLVGLFMCWFIFAAVSIWRCAGNVRFAPWGVIAKGVTVVAGAMYIAAAITTF